MTDSERERVSAVYEMRRAQRRYFSTREPAALDTARQWEHRVDLMIADRQQERQQTLFEQPKEMP
jgi:hypothetical protein